jgi:hypothetical protein
MTEMEKPVEPPEVDLQKKTTQAPGSPMGLASQSWPSILDQTGTISNVVNIILVVALILMGRQIFDLKQVVSQQLVDGLYTFLG